ncbi:hypothetical protein ZEAMMB73_Zm00001d049045 [Zea mays]|uniref:Uncharacterized protein n=1 Tax=Zea mays TaxID=4577 RepID=A0A1D6PRY0_MAIZE|nr:hypothetical protein ZEAMMB73_Zm00001d049045 [Zea mays]
MATVAQVNFWI